MIDRTGRVILAFTALAALAAPSVAAQDVVRTPASTRHGANELRELLFSEGYRDLWGTPIPLPVLDLGTYAGGLTPIKTGGNQSVTLHFEGAQGRTYIFRSVDKFTTKTLDVEDLQNTPVGDVIADQTATLLPAATLAAERMQEALGLMYPKSALYVMPDDPRLDEFRETYAGLVGLMVERPNEGPEDTPGWRGFTKIVGSEKLLENLDESGKDRVAAREYLTTRLFDFILGDTDRGADQWRWAETERGDLTYWRPIPLDRDYAFMDADGLLIRGFSAFYPKLVVFGEDFSDLEGLVFMTESFDRRVLAELPRAAWDSIAASVQARLTDAVIEDAVGQLPAEYQRLRGADLIAGLRARRDKLGGIAEDYYRMVARSADVHGSFDSEAAEVERLPDGSVMVRLFSDKDAVLADGSSMTNGHGADAPYFERRFVPGETKEVRVYLHHGNDRARVHGAETDAVRVRVIGGPGDDLLVDETRGKATYLYDAQGENRIEPGPETSVDRRPYAPDVAMEGELPPEDDEEEDNVRRPPIWGRFQDLIDAAVELDKASWVEHKIGLDKPKDYGAEISTFRPELGYFEGAGLVVGGGPAYTRYGFRRDPHELLVELNGLYALGENGFGAELKGDYRFENSRMGLSVVARGTQFGAYRFYGFGNASALPSNHALSLVAGDEVTVIAGMDWHLGPQSWLTVGPVLRWGDPEFEETSPIAQAAPLGSESIGQVGARVGLQLDGTEGAAVPERGLFLSAGASAYPSVWDLPEPFGEVHAEARAYLPLVGRTTLALRAGGERVWGDFPVHDAAFLGGGWSLRGYRFQRFAGEAMAFGGAEIRAPVARITLLTRGDLGVIGLVDAGRVWSEGDLDRDWHTGFGGGLWFESLGRALSVTWANGEENRFYLRWGMPF